MFNWVVELMRDWRYGCQPKLTPQDLAKDFSGLDKLRRVAGSGRFGGKMRYYDFDMGLWDNFPFDCLEPEEVAASFEEAVKISNVEEFDSFGDLLVKRRNARYSFTFRGGENLGGLFKKISFRGRLTYDFEVGNNDS